MWFVSIQKSKEHKTEWIKNRPKRTGDGCSGSTITLSGYNSNTQGRQRQSHPFCSFTVLNKHFIFISPTVQLQCHVKNSFKSFRHGQYYTWIPLALKKLGLDYFLFMELTLKMDWNVWTSSTSQADADAVQDGLSGLCQLTNVRIQLLQKTSIVWQKLD